MSDGNPPVTTKAGTFRVPDNEYDLLTLIGAGQSIHRDLSVASRLTGWGKNYWPVRHQQITVFCSIIIVSYIFQSLSLSLW